MLEPDLEPDHIFLSLLQTGQTFGKPSQPWIWSIPHDRILRREGGNQLRINAVGLGTAQLHDRICPHLLRLQHDDREPRGPQILDQITLIAATCLKPDPLNMMLTHQPHQTAKAIRCVGHTPGLLDAVNGDVQLLLCNVDTGGNRANLLHLRRPFLVMRTHGSFNHPGSMKMPIAIWLSSSPQGSGACDPTIGDPLRVADRSGSSLSERLVYS